MRPGFNMGVDPVNYEKPQSIVDETLEFAAQFGATDLIIQSYLEGAIPGEEKWELDDILSLKNKVESFKNTTLFYVLKYITRDCDINSLRDLKDIINMQIKTLEILERNKNE